MCLDDPAYLEYILDLRAAGSRSRCTACRTAAPSASARARGWSTTASCSATRRKSHTYHSRNRDSIYWGLDRYTDPAARALIGLREGAGRRAFAGHVPSSHNFWGDYCRDQVKYVRNLVFDSNLDRVNPAMPYPRPR